MTLQRLRVCSCASKMQSGSKTRFCSKDHASASEMHAAWSQQARQQVPRRGTLAPIRANEGGGCTAWLRETPPLAPSPLGKGRGGGGCTAWLSLCIVLCLQTPPLTPPLWERGGEVEDALPGRHCALCIVSKPHPRPLPFHKGEGRCPGRHCSLLANPTSGSLPC